MLPTTEIDILTTTATDAIDLAAVVKPAGGYACLLAGIHRAEDALEEGLPRAEELVGCWRQAVENYTRRYAVDLE